jgi:hypothetical protein
MENAKRLNRNFETITWGVFFIWWGLTDSDIGLFKFLPHGAGIVGIGLILLGLNAARSLNGVPTSGFTITLGVLALVLGGLELAGSVLSLPFELPVLAILLIVLGVIMLTRELLRTRSG